MPADDESVGVTTEQGVARTGMHRFSWRRAIALNSLTNQTYRIVIALLGAAVVVLGLVLVPLPGPGWLVVFLGVAIWASEFQWAASLLGWGREKLGVWNDWMGRQSVWVKGLVGTLTCAFVAGVLWLMFVLLGVPSLVPDPVAGWLRSLPGVD